MFSKVGLRRFNICITTNNNLLKRSFSSFGNENKIHEENKISQFTKLKKNFAKFNERFFKLDIPLDVNLKPKISSDNNDVNSSDELKQHFTKLYKEMSICCGLTLLSGIATASYLSYFPIINPEHIEYAKYTSCVLTGINCFLIMNKEIMNEEIIEKKSFSKLLKIYSLNIGSSLVFVFYPHMISISSLLMSNILSVMLFDRAIKSVFKTFDATNTNLNKFPYIQTGIIVTSFIDAYVGVLPFYMHITPYFLIIPCMYKITKYNVNNFLKKNINNFYPNQNQNLNHNLLIEHQRKLMNTYIYMLLATHMDIHMVNLFFEKFG